MLQAIREDLDEHQRSVMSCIDNAQQLIEQGQEVLSKDELQNIQKNSETLKKRFNKANNESEKLLRKLNTALEELRKFSVSHDSLNNIFLIYTYIFVSRLKIILVFYVNF